MRYRRLLSLLLLLAVHVSTPRAARSDDQDTPLLKTAQFTTELRSRTRALRTAASPNDTTWIGFAPGHSGPGNWWSVYAGSGADGYYRPVNGGVNKGVWDFENAVQGDSLQGWWPLPNIFATTGGITQIDRNRPWWAIDIGNMANYRMQGGNGRTFGVVGVWHRDGGSLQPAPLGVPTPRWAPAQGSYAAWMGLRAHGDAANVDAVTLNPFNEDVMMFSSFGSISTGGNDQGFPGYGSQMDQMLYRDIDLSSAPPSASLTIRFKFRSVMSKDATTAASNRTGWFDSDPLGVTAGTTNPQKSNFISSSDAGDALAPRDSFMVYLGAGVEGTWTPAANNFGQSFPAQAVYDPQRRWFGEVLKWDRDPSTIAGNPQPLAYRELLSAAGNWPADSGSSGYVDTTFVVSSTALASLVQGGRVRLVFRVKTNRGFDDQGTSYSSNMKGAVVVDRVSYKIGAGAEVVFGDFENASDIDNAPNVDALAAWKSTGKPPASLHHVHALADLRYEDLCGQKGDVSRICNMSGVVISAGDHDHGEASGGLLAGSAQRELNDILMSPVICLKDDDGNPETKNVMGLYGAGGNGGVGDVSAADDYYMVYDVYTGVTDLFTNGNGWIWGAMSYPGNAKSTHGSYPAWGQMRFAPTGPAWNPDPQCFTDMEFLIGFGVVRTSNPSGIPDSLRFLLRKTQSCFRFGVTTGCSADDGLYWDNLALAIVDAKQPTASASIWNWINDAFPANETPSLPGSAGFDTTAAHVKTGLNNGQWADYDGPRIDVPGDSVLVQTSNAVGRLDIVFRILPGPGNYEPVGRPDQGTLVRRPDQRAVVTKGDGSFWDQYRQIPGDFASPNASTLHHNAVGGWDPNVWNSARCDTAEINLFARQGAGSGNILGGPPWPYDWMATYHESDPHFATLGISKNRCFVTTATAPITSQVCDGTVPSYISNRPEHAGVTGTTKEFTKVIPDGLLTPGAHVEYFFRAQAGTAPGAALGMVPDTTVVFQADEGSTDGHRWQEFGVLPNRWKEQTYRHPGTLTFGTGPACMLVVDNNDRRGNERVWVGVSDTIGATPQRWWGAHNGWHAVGGGDLDDPADNRRGADGQPGFVAEHLGQAGSGSAWDMYQVKGAELVTTAAGSIGSRYGTRTGGPGQQIVLDKRNRIGPTHEMLNAYYTMMLFLSGDLNGGVLGPYGLHSQNDAGVLSDWLHAGSTSTPNRGFWAIGDGFVESVVGYTGDPTPYNFVYDDLGVVLEHHWYAQYSGNTDELVHLRLKSDWQGKGSAIQVFGVRNLCLWSNDVLGPYIPLASVASEYDSRSNPGGANRRGASVFKAWDPTSPWVSLVDGWDIEHLTHANDVRTLDRSGYFAKLFANVWNSLCPVTDGTVLTEVANDPELIAFLNVGNNPMRHGPATVQFGLPVADRVEVRIYDVSGRLVRTLADRRFTAGTHTLRWDGADDGGRAVSRGVYFTRLRQHDGGFVANRKLVVLE